MIMRWLLAATHLLALGIGLGAVWSRGRALRGRLDSEGLRRVFRSDAVWGIAALLWLGTGLARLLGGFEKGTLWYMRSGAFQVKMGLFLLLLILEIWPMMMLFRWRMALRRGVSVDTRRAGALATISDIEAFLVVAIVFAATAMARGMWSAP